MTATGILDHLPPDQRAQILDRLDALTDLAAIASTPPLPPDPATAR